MARGGKLATCAQHGPARPALSSGECAGGGAGDFSRPIDLLALRRVFPDRWSAFLRAHFCDAVHVAYFFGVDERTARNWLDGVGSPRAEAVVAAVQRFPGAAVALLEAA